MSEKQSSSLLEPEAIELLEVHGIPYVKHGVAHSAEEAVEIADLLGYPVVLKVVSHDVLHKSDAGGVALGLENAASVRQAYGQVLRAVRDYVPGAEVQGMLVCEQAPSGLEVIVGALKDPLFGPTLMFGLGGIFTEVLKDVSFRVAPLERRDAEEMILEIRGYPLLAGARGQKSCDLEALVDLLVRGSQMVMARPDIQELDLNPVRVYNEGILVLDVRILIQQAQLEKGDYAISVGPYIARSRSPSHHYSIQEKALMKDVLAQRVISVPPSGIRKFFDIAATMHDVISLGIGEPDFVTPSAIRRVGIEALERGETHYTSNSGLLELREAISEHLERLYHVHYDPATEILVTVGVSEALHLALTAIVNPGDEVIVPTPCFVSYAPEVIFAGGKPIILCTTADNRFQVSASDIEEVLTARTKALLLGYPNNPTGAVMSRKRLLEIARLAEERDLMVISDEIYDRLVYGTEHTCFASLPGMKQRTVLLQGFSKAYAMTGWRLGYASGSAEVVAGMRKVHQYIIMSAPTIAQFAALEALRSGEADVQRMVTEYDRRRRVVVAGLNDIGLTCFEPKGAFYAFPSIEVTGMTSGEFAERLLEEEYVAVIPGTAFGECGEGHVRISYATSLEKIEVALERMRRFVQRHKR